MKKIIDKRNTKAQDIGESFLNGNIELTIEKCKGTVIVAQVAEWISENSPDDLARFLRIITSGY